jgi:hypothetical protein
MQLIIGYVASWVLYWIGDTLSRVMVLTDWLAFLYEPYNWCMTESYNIQEWSGAKSPWVVVSTDHEQHPPRG